MAKKRQVDELRDRIRRERDETPEERRARQLKERDERRRAKHDQTRDAHLAAFLELGGTKEEFDALWPNLEQNVIGKAAADRVAHKAQRARQQIRRVWGGNA